MLRYVKNKIKGYVDERLGDLASQMAALQEGTGELWQRYFLLADVLIPIENIDASPAAPFSVGEGA